MGLDNITFNSIPLEVLTPGQYFEVDASRATSGLAGMPRRILLIGEKLSTGAAPEHQATRLLAEGDAVRYFGAGSPLERMAAAVRKAHNDVELWAMPTADLSGVYGASGTNGMIDIDSAATHEAGTLAVYIAGRRVAVSVAKTDTVIQIAQRLTAAINADPYLPVSAANNGLSGSIGLTSKWLGASSTFDLRLNYYAGEATPTGLTVTLTTQAGNGLPAIAPVLAAIGDEPFTALVLPWADAAMLAELEAWAAERYGPFEPKPVTLFAGVTGDLTALVALGNARNSPHTVLLATQATPEPAYVWAAELAAINEYEATLDPARPLQTLAMARRAPQPAARFDRAERALLLAAGISTTTVGSTGSVAIERVVTTYKTNTAGVKDPAWRDIETRNTIDYLRWVIRARIASKFPRMKLADDGTQFGPGQPIVTPSIIRAELIALFKELEAAGLVERLDQFKQDLQVLRSATDMNRVNVVFPPDIVNQLRVVAGSIQFRL